MRILFILYFLSFFFFLLAHVGEDICIVLGNIVIYPNSNFEACLHFRLYYDFQISSDILFSSWNEILEKVQLQNRPNYQMQAANQ